MENFQLCYPLPDRKDTFIAPQLLDPQVPDYKTDWDYNDNIQLRFHYPVFMPRGILSRAIVKLHERIDEQRLVWRAGVILKDEFARAELLEMRGDKEIRIRVSGRLKRDLLMEIVRALNDLHHVFPKLKINKLIPCNCVTCVELEEPHFYQLDKLQTRLAHGKLTIECDNPDFEEVNIHSLLDDGYIAYSKSGDVYVEGDYYERGDRVEGDNIRIRDIKKAKGIAVGRKAKGSATD